MEREAFIKAAAKRDNPSGGKGVRKGQAAVEWMAQQAAQGG